MVNSNLVIIKMGGSVITFKERPLMPNMTGIEGIANILSELRKRYKIIIVHGGGSFGHYWSVKYDMHTKPFPYSDEGVAVVHESMIKLNHIITDRFINFNLKPYTLQPSTFVYNGIANLDRINEIVRLTTDNNLIPVTFGDVIHTTENNFSILSGDTIMSMLCTALHPQYCIFTTNVDGLFGDVEKRDLIREIYLDENGEFINTRGKNYSNIESSKSPFDVTGGMKRKISESVPIVKSGLPVHIINGFRPETIFDIIDNRDYIGTRIRLNQQVK